MRQPTKEERDYTVERGKEIYQKELKAKFEPEHIGKFLVIDVDTGHYEMDADHLTAARRVADKNPDGRRYGMLIGYNATGGFGGRRPKRIE